MTFKKRVRQNELKRLSSANNHPTRYRCLKQKQNQARQSTSFQEGYYLIYRLVTLLKSRNLTPYLTC